MNRKLKTTGSGLALLFLSALAGCSSTKTIPYESKWNAPFAYVNEVKPDQKDLKSKLEYGIINDERFLYITLKTRSPATIQAILSSGARISFSSDGKKKNTSSILFPVVTKDDRRAMSRNDMDIPNSMALGRMLEAFNKEALWKDRSGQHFINLVSGNGGVRATIHLDEGRELTQQIIIPLEVLGVDISLSSLLDVGIKVDDTSSQGGGLSPGVSVGMGGMGGYGMGGIGMGGVGITMGRGGGSRGTDRSVDIKLQVQLAKSNS